MNRYFQNIREKTGGMNTGQNILLVSHFGTACTYIPSGFSSGPFFLWKDRAGVYLCNDKPVH